MKNKRTDKILRNEGEKQTTENLIKKQRNKIK